MEGFNSGVKGLTVSVKYPNVFYLQRAGHFFDIIHVSWIECVTRLKIFERFLNLPLMPQNKTLQDIMMKCKGQAIFSMQYNAPFISRQCNSTRSTSSSSNISFIDTSLVKTFSVSTYVSVKMLRMPSFRGEIKPLVPCRRFAACKIPKWHRNGVI
jgi:hypothetical protein